MKDKSPVKKWITLDVKYTLKSVIDHFDSSKAIERKENGNKIKDRMTGNRCE